VTIQTGTLNFLIIKTEPKPPRSTSSDERAPLWNDDRGPIPSIQMTNIPGINLALTSNDYLSGSVGGSLSENECILHVICSPLVSLEIKI
jgi:hypothetical protein